ncbi:hypothetical protein L9F63_002721 [Diploptera punctata]|uniref:Uncharacterized protein n=1 Tax=Diploptera punctata TaxID=6984 RepID=A0AAD7ZST4_DIPPU|nr:hypothetical protein L9F63_002721 [Diploptera punctata]
MIFVNDLINISSRRASAFFLQPERLNVLYEKNWTHLVHEQLRKFETNVVAATKVEGYDGKELLDSDRQWSFSGALLYSVTVITTIGQYRY